jgi:hypothetical protein
MSYLKCNCKNLTKEEDYSVEVESDYDYSKRWNNPYTTHPNTLPNGGLYSGECSAGRAWIPTKVDFTSNNFTRNLLKQACPPPGALEQYVGTNRPGNNYVSMDKVYWYNKTPVCNKGPFNIKVTHTEK